MKQKKKKTKKNKKDNFFTDWVLIVPLLVLIWIQVAAYFMISQDNNREYARRRTHAPSYTQMRHEYYRGGETVNVPNPSPSPTPQISPEEYSGVPTLQ